VIRHQHAGPYSQRGHSSWQIPGTAATPRWRSLLSAIVLPPAFGAQACSRTRRAGTRVSNFREALTKCAAILKTPSQARWALFLTAGVHMVQKVHTVTRRSLRSVFTVQDRNKNTAIPMPIFTKLTLRLTFWKEMKICLAIPLLNLLAGHGRTSSPHDALLYF
jgi:hypothetical protein